MFRPERRGNFPEVSWPPYNVAGATRREQARKAGLRRCCRPQLKSRGVRTLPVKVANHRTAQALSSDAEGAPQLLLCLPIHPFSDQGRRGLTSTGSRKSGVGAFAGSCNGHAASHMMRMLPTDDIFAGGALEFLISFLHNKQRPLLATHRQSALTLLNPDATDDFEPWSRPTFLTLPKTIITRAPRAAAMMR